MQIRLTEKKDCMYRIDISVMSWLLFSDWYTKIIVTVLELVYVRIFHLFLFFFVFVLPFNENWIIEESNTYLYDIL